MASKQRKLKIEDVALYVAATITLLCLLSYTFVHTGDVLASWINPRFMGYVAAFGIELGIAGLSLRRTLVRGSGPFATLTLGVLLLISSFANVFSGFAAKTGALPTWESVWLIDPVQATMGVLATAMIPLVVFATGEIVGGDVKKVAATLQVTPVVKEPDPEPQANLEPQVEQKPLKPYICPCGDSFDTAQEKAIHARRCETWKQLKNAHNGREE